MKSDVKITGNRVEITRTFDAPRARVFADPAKLQRWTGCKEAANVVCQSDFRVGGGFTTKMHIGGHASCDGTFTGTYEEILEPQKIACNINLGPAVSRITIEFFEEGPQARVVLTQEGLPGEIIQFVEQGSLESFDKLDVVLAAQSAVAPPSAARAATTPSA